MVCSAARRSASVTRLWNLIISGTFERSVSVASAFGGVRLPGSDVEELDAEHRRGQEALGRLQGPAANKIEAVLLQETRGEVVVQVTRPAAA